MATPRPADGPPPVGCWRTRRAQRSARRAVRRSWLALLPVFVGPDEQVDLDGVADAAQRRELLGGGVALVVDAPAGDVLHRLHLDRREHALLLGLDGQFADVVGDGVALAEEFLETVGE